MTLETHQAGTLKHTLYKVIFESDQKLVELLIALQLHGK